MATLRQRGGEAPPRAPARGRRRTGGLLPGLGLAVGAAVAMGGAAPALKALGTTELTAVQIIQARALVGAVLLMAVAATVHRGHLRVRAGDVWLVLLYGAVSLALNQVVFTMSLARLPVGVALLVEYLSPLLVALWVRLVQRKHVSGLVWAGIALTLVGLSFTGEVWSGGGLDGPGLGLAFLAALTLAGRFLLAERGLRSYEPLVMSAWGAAVGAVTLTLAGLAEPFPLAALGRGTELNGWTVPVWALMVWVGVIGMAGGLALGAAAQRRLPPASASLMLSLEVVAGAGLAYVFLGEALSAEQLAGSALMLTGIVLAQLAVLRRRAPAGSS